MRLDHTKCHLYRGCPACRRNDDRWDAVVCTLCTLFVFTFVIPVVPVIVLIALQA